MINHLYTFNTASSQEFTHGWSVTHVRTCSRSSCCVQCGALIWPYSSKCSLVVMWSKRTSYCMQTPSSLRTSSVLVCMSLPYTSMEPADGAKRPVRRDLCRENYLTVFFLTHFFLCFPQFNGSFFCSIPFLQKFKTSAETVALKMEMQALQLRKIIRLISTTLQFQCQVEQNNLPVSSKLLRGWKRR